MNYIKKHKLNCFIILAYTIVIVFGFVIYKMFLGNSGLPVYGDRLDDIQSVPIEEEKYSKIQEEIIPVILDGFDAIGQAQTGTGKNLAYASSVLSKIDVSTNFVKTIVLVPTRELAIQVKDEFENLNTSDDFDILAVYGGSSIELQLKQLKKGVDVE